MSVWFRLVLFPIIGSLDSMFLFFIYVPPSTTHGSWSGCKITQAKHDSKETANLRNTAQSSQILHPREFSSTPHISAHDERLMPMVDSRSSYWCWLRREFHRGNGTAPRADLYTNNPNTAVCPAARSGDCEPRAQGPYEKKQQFPPCRWARPARNSQQVKRRQRGCSHTRRRRDEYPSRLKGTPERWTGNILVAARSARPWIRADATICDPDRRPGWPAPQCHWCEWQTLVMGVGASKPRDVRLQPLGDDRGVIAPVPSRCRQYV